MTELKYRPVPHDQDGFRERAFNRKGFREAYEGLGREYALVRELLYMGPDEPAAMGDRRSLWTKT